MNKGIIFFGVGTVVGGAIGYVVGRNVYKKKLVKAEHDIDVLLKEINAPLKESEVSDDSDDTDDASAPTTASEDKKMGEVKPSYQEFRDSVLKYRGMSTEEIAVIDPAEKEAPIEDPPEESEEKEESDDDWDELTPEEREERWFIEHGYYIDESNEDDYEAEAMNAEMNSGKKPRLITEESFFNEYPMHDKEELMYYTDDDVLIDTSNEEEIDDVDRAVGDCLDKFSFRDNDEESTIYVRNFAFGIDYVINKTFGSFYDET